MKSSKFIKTNIHEYLNENNIEQLKNNIISVFSNKIEGRLLNKKQAEELQKEIETNYIDDIFQHFNREKQDIRMNIFNYDNPLFERDVNGINLRIAEGFIRNKRKTYLLYADGKIIGEFYSVPDIKMIVKYIEDNLIKPIPHSKKELNENFSERLSIDSLIGDTFYIKVGSSSVGGKWDRDSFIERIKSAIRHSLFDFEFFYNWTDNGQEYNKVFKKDVLEPMIEDIDNTLNKYFVFQNSASGKELYFKYDGDIQAWMDNWFNTNKDISDNLRNDYFYYRKKYHGANI